MKTAIRGSFIKYWGTTKHFSPNFKLNYTYKRDQSEFFIKLFLVDGLVYADYSPALFSKLQSLMNSINQFIRDIPIYAQGVEKISFKNKKTVFLQNLDSQLKNCFQSKSKPFYVPAGRSLLSALSGTQKAIQILSATNDESSSNIDFTLRTFFDEIVAIKPFFRDTLEEMIDNERAENANLNQNMLNRAIAVLDKIVKDRYQVDRNTGAEWLKLADNNLVKLSFASSGQQESIWVLLQIFWLLLKQEPTFIIFEEPEAHLFPIAQKDIIELVCLFANALPNNGFLLTTHSPYILSALNNFIYAHLVGQQKPAEVGEIINKNSWLSPDKFAAYFVENGEIRNIVDPTEKIINTHEIDSVSAIINQQFEQLFNLDDNYGE